MASARPGAEGSSAWALRGLRILPSPDAPPIERGTVVLRDGHVEAFGPDVPVPPGARSTELDGATVTAGFWNAHVHFTERHWSPARHPDARTLEAQLGEMLTRWGFTTVVDAGSDPRSTFPLRARVASGELAGPRILSAGTGLYPPHGIPYYLHDEIPWYLRWLIPQPRSPSAAARAARTAFAQGADLLKLFTGSYVARGQVRPMPEPNARAAVEVAHGLHRLVYAHPSDRTGTEVAVRSGVDVLAHAPDATEGIDDEFLRQAVDRSMGMIPTLRMFAATVTTDARYLDPIYDVVRRFRALGGSLLFGTDVGYLREYSTVGEVEGLGRAGLDAREILRTLTTAPADRFGAHGTGGRILAGQPADLTVLDGDPMEDPAVFARVRMTIRAGRVLWPRG